MKRSQVEIMGIALILVLALLVRLWGVGYDLPFIYHPDEPYYITISQRIFKTGDLNPHFFNYPSLFFYINAFSYVPYYQIGRIAMDFNTPGNILPPTSLTMGVTKAQTPSAVLLGRVITVLFGVGVVGLTYLGGKKLTRRASIGALASLMVALSPTNVLHSRFMTPDTFVTFFALASFLASVLIYQQGKTWQYMFAGVCVGLAASSKYNGSLTIVILIASHFLRNGKSGLKRPVLYLTLALCGFVFFVTTPFAILDFPEFIGDLRYEAQHYATGHAGAEGNTLAWYMHYLWRQAGGLYGLAALSIIYGSLMHLKKTILLSVFPIVYFGFINRFIVRNDRTLLPMLPFLLLLSAWFIVDVFNRVRLWQPKLLRTLSTYGFLGIVATAIVFPTSKTVAHARRLMIETSRETARIWIHDTLPPGTKIAVGPYSAFVDPSKYDVQGMLLIEHEPAWYVEKGFRYLVFGQGMYGRFYREPERYRDEVLKYNSLFSQFDLVAVFTDGGYEVRIYRVD
jgi:4-amino-4-deoxy-L-arabinose transferase-like glycosyltransferase